MSRQESRIMIYRNTVHSRLTISHDGCRTTKGTRRIEIRAVMNSDAHSSLESHSVMKDHHHSITSPETNS